MARSSAKFTRLSNSCIVSLVFWAAQGSTDFLLINQVSIGRGRIFADPATKPYKTDYHSQGLHSDASEASGRIILLSRYDRKTQPILLSISSKNRQMNGQLGLARRRNTPSGYSWARSKSLKQKYTDHNRRCRLDKLKLGGLSPQCAQRRWIKVWF